MINSSWIMMMMNLKMSNLKWILILINWSWNNNNFFRNNYRWVLMKTTRWSVYFECISSLHLIDVYEFFFSFLVIINQNRPEDHLFKNFQCQSSYAVFIKKIWLSAKKNFMMIIKKVGDDDDDDDDNTYSFIIN